MIPSEPKRAAGRSPAQPAREPGPAACFAAARPGQPGSPNPVGEPGPDSSPQGRVPAADCERRSAGMPHPETGAEGPCTTASAPVRARALQAPSPALLVGTPDEGTAETRLRRGGTAAGSVVDADATLPADPQARYAAARAKALAVQARKRPADPQQAPRQADPRVRVAEMMAPCTCTHPELNHWRTESGRVTWCSIATGAGPCGCQSYQRATDGAG